MNIQENNNISHIVSEEGSYLYNGSVIAEVVDCPSNLSSNWRDITDDERISIEGELSNNEIQ